MKSWSPFLIAFFACGAATAQVGPRLDSLFSSRYPANAPGVAVLVAQKGTILYEKAFGSASLELKTPLAPSMLFDLASVSKQFTAVAVLQLVEQGRIRLSDSIQRYIPGFPHAVTIENLLTHTSGIPDYMRLPTDDPYRERRDYTVAQVIDTLKTKPLEFEPGTQFRYSNSGYFLLGYIIERVTGEPYHTYLEKHLFKPLGLTHTFFKLPNEVIPGLVNGYKNASEKADFWSATLPYAAGGLVSNVEDLYAWQRGLPSLLKPETLQKAWTGSRGYGYGWYINDSSISHGGAITGFRTSVVYYPRRDLFIAVLSNCECTNADELTAAVSDIMLGRAYVQPSFAYAGTYTMQGHVIVIRREGNHLVADVRGQGVFPLLFSTPTTFTLQGVTDATGEFGADGFTIHQHGDYFWKKTTP